MDRTRKNLKIDSFEEEFKAAATREGIAYDDFIELSRRPVASLTEDELKLLYKINSSVELPQNNVILSKVVNEKDFRNCLKNGEFSETVGKCMTRMQDMQDCLTYEDYFNELGLNYGSNQKYLPNGDANLSYNSFLDDNAMYIKRFVSSNTEDLAIRSFGGNTVDDVAKVMDAIGTDKTETIKLDMPYQGTGLTRDIEGGAGKFELYTKLDDAGKATYGKVADGAAIYEVVRGVEGERLVAVRIRNNWYKVRY